MSVLSVPEAIPYIDYIRYVSKSFLENTKILDGFSYKFNVASTSRYDYCYTYKGSYKIVRFSKNLFSRIFY
jgi:hypothetical protein